MMEVREYFSIYKEEHMDFHIIMGNRSKYIPVGRGTIDFQRESGASTIATNVLHVSRLGMNVISVYQL